jgi:hypothetical protein
VKAYVPPLLLAVTIKTITMQQVYLLLRNNQQMGPYTFEELLALHLKPFDLVWIEGKSHGWRYPNEVEALKPYVASSPGSQKPAERSVSPQEKPGSSSIPRTPGTSSKNIFVSMPFTSARQNVENENTDPIEQKAEELRKRAEAYAPSQESVKTNYARDLQHAEEEYTQWVYQSKTKKKTLLNKNTFAISGIGILIFLTGWWVTNRLTESSPVLLPAVVQQEEKLPASISEPQADVQTGSEPVQKPLVVTGSAEMTKKEENKKLPQENIIATQNKKQTASTTKTTLEENIPAGDAGQKVTSTPTTPEEERTTVSAPVEKKKTLKEKINELFKNKKTDEAGVQSEPGTTQSTSGERSATHRNEEKEMATSITDVSDQVEIKTNKIADSWMMGVKNLKLTLVNRSNLTVSSAKVDILYYSEQNNLLEKKTISFANIAPGKSQTVAAPDQRLADHIEHKVVFAKGFDNAYASQ